MSISTPTIRERIRSYILQTVHVSKDKVNDDTLIFREGFLDSMGFIVLITYLEEEFSIKTGDADLVEENFESINAISAFVEKKLS